MAKNPKNREKNFEKGSPGDQLSKYIKLMEEQNLDELEVTDGAFQVKLVRQAKGVIVPVAHAAPVARKSAKSSSPEKKTPVEEGIPVKAPIAGVFYRARSPQSPPFANVGDTVNASQAVCIIEAMKVMNEIVAGASGRVKKILVENGKPVQANQTLFILSAD